MSREISHALTAFPNIVKAEGEEPAFMTDMERYDILVLGSGEAGKHLAWTFANAGRRVSGIPVTVGGKVIGAVGASGGSVEQDIR